jgi:hypothetical protein
VEHVVLADSIVQPFLPLILPLSDIPTAIAAAVRQLIHSVFLVAFIRFRSQGPAGEKLQLPTSNPPE